MNIRTQWSNLVGEWAGTNRVWLMPGEVELAADTTDELVIRMVNIPPGMDEMLAVEARYGRVHTA